MALGLVLRLVQIGTEPFWHDEAWTVHYIQGSQAEIWSWLPRDPGNPPLYYSLLSAWSSLVGNGEVALRLPAAILATLTIPVLHAVGRVVDGRRVGLASAALFAVTPYQLRYGQEARAYALVTLCAAVVMLCVAVVLARDAGSWGGRWPWAGYILAAGIASLSHNSGLLVPVAANVAVAASLPTLGARAVPFFRRWALAQIGVVAIWALWAPGFIRQWRGVYRDFWIPEPSPLWIARQGKELLADLIPVAAGFVLVGSLALLAAVGVGHLRSRRPWVEFLLAFMLTAPLVELVVSMFRPVFIARGVIAATLSLYVLAAVGLFSLRRISMRVVLAGAVVALTLWGTSLYFVRFIHPETDAAAALVRAELLGDDAIVFTTVDLQVPFGVYFGSDVLAAVPTAAAGGDLSGISGATRVWYLSGSDGDGGEGLSRLLEAGRLIGSHRFEHVWVRLVELEEPLA